MTFLKPGDRVRCVKGFTNSLETGGHYRVAVVVTDGIDFNGKCSGVILTPYRIGTRKVTFPYVWDASRFEKL